MAKKSNPSPVVVVLVLVVIVGAVAATIWVHKHGLPVSTPAPQTDKEAASGAPLNVAADKIDPANEDRLIDVTGDLKVVTPTHDTQLGIDANAVMLMRYADMLQWQEQCSGKDCTYRQVWSPQLINSKKFRVPEGHQNPSHLPVTTARYPSGEVRVGAFRVNAALFGDSAPGAPLPIKPQPYSVTNSKLPSNLAISFRDRNGTLYAGDPDHPSVGDVRVIYRIIPAQKVQIIGTQHGDGVIVKSVKLVSPSS
ncbi:MAG TPA: TMEM43 family protein [Rhodanobacteraceae bacterium]|jgi:hypothetical protein|nr:TMEM43 family protein [Rhodanobacteraceae bacterium]